MITKIAASTGKVHVTFSMPAEILARSIHVVGDFNNWSTTANPLRRDTHAWTISIELDSGRSYEYRYLVDGKWFNDWQADDYKPNEHGGDNSVVITVPYYNIMSYEYPMYTA
jgi:1,4-alpha-glucan branching enzyme